MPYAEAYLQEQQLSNPALWQCGCCPEMPCLIAVVAPGPGAAACGPGRNLGWLYAAGVVPVRLPSISLLLRRAGPKSNAKMRRRVLLSRVHLLLPGPGCGTLLAPPADAGT